MVDRNSYNNFQKSIFDRKTSLDNRPEWDNNFHINKEETKSTINVKKISSFQKPALLDSSQINSKIQSVSGLRQISVDLAEKNLTYEDLKEFNHHLIEVGGDEMQQSGGSATVVLHSFKLQEPKLVQNDKN